MVNPDWKSLRDCAMSATNEQDLRKVRETLEQIISNKDARDTHVIPSLMSFGVSAIRRIPLKWRDKLLFTTYDNIINSSIDNSKDDHAMISLLFLALVLEREREVQDVCKSKYSAGTPLVVQKVLQGLSIYNK